jgi:hypothetical protein
VAREWLYLETVKVGGGGAQRSEEDNRVSLDFFFELRVYCPSS